MEVESSHWWQRFRRQKPPGAASAFSGDHGELPVARPTLGLCFEYARDARFESPSLSDCGLERVLAVLYRFRVRATFNCAGKLCETVPDQIHMIAEHGHEIGAYGYADEVVREQSDDDLKATLYRCRAAFAHLRLQPIGYRSRRSECDQRLYPELVLHRFLYNAEHDHAHHPYVMIEGSPALVRVPVCTDDLGFVRHPNHTNRIVSKHHRYLRKALAREHFVSIAFHPWVLAENPQRMADFEEWLDTACRSGAKIGTLADALPARYRTASPAEPE